MSQTQKARRHFDNALTNSN